MPVDAARPATLAELGRALLAVDPAAVLLAPRLVRRAIRRDRGVVAVGRRVPHRAVWTIAGAAAIEILGRGPLGLWPGDPPPPRMILIAQPDRRKLARMTRAEALRWCWRRLFHAHVHEAIAARIGEDRGRIEGIGRTAFDEIRAVLRQEGDLVSPDDDRAVFEEFAAVFLELRYFEPQLLPAYFPSLREPDRVFARLAEEIDPPALIEGSRPEGAIDPLGAIEDEEPQADPDEEASARGPAPEGYYRALIAQADEATARGNAVRAAILRERAARRAAPRLAGRTRAGARAELDQLARRLREALDLNSEEVRHWRGAIPALLVRAARGGWTAEARLLYDLQAACVDHERGVYALRPVAWALSLGRIPLKRPLPGQREVLVSKHLRRAVRRLATVRLGGPDRARLAPLLREALHRAEGRLRDRFRGPIGRAIESTGLVPRNLPERVALTKLVEELLDRIIARDYITMGDLRDALSQSNLKLPDVAGPVAFVRGDRLLLADRHLAAALDGAYRRGEIYLRWLQRLSSLAFGTAAGRALTRYVALPFGGAFIILEGLQHILELARVHRHLFTIPSWVALAAVLLGLIYVEGFRRSVAEGLRGAFRAARWIVIGLPRLILRLPPLRWLVESRSFALGWRACARPLLLAVLIWWALRASHVDRRVSLLTGTVTFLALVPILNSRAGRELEEVIGDLIGRGWHRLTSDLLPGLFRLVMDTFGRILEAIDRLLYAVDEWLRFRAGQGRGALVAKAVLGMAWAVVAYLTRIYVNLLIEPQVNPVKHFPVVTVSHKLMVAFVPRLYRLFRAPLLPLGPIAADAIAATTVFLLPGFFGFLVWELKANWRLYEANRPRSLRPVVVGHHGESMARFLRPGLHSGTIPKLFGRLRRAERAALRTGRRKAARKHRATLGHVEEAIRHFVERDVLALLREARRPGDPAFAAGAVALGLVGVRVELRPTDRRGASLWIDFEERAGCLTAGLDAPDWWNDLAPAQRHPLEVALAGLYRMAGVDRVRGPSPGTDTAAPPIPWASWVAAWESGRPEPARVAEALSGPAADRP